jgi:hypothetical protein
MRSIADILKLYAVGSWNSLQVLKENVLLIKEAVSQLISTPKIPLLFGFRALYAFLFHPILNCWTASKQINIKKGGKVWKLA